MLSISETPRPEAGVHHEIRSLRLAKKAVLLPSFGSVIQMEAKKRGKNFGHSG